MASTVPNPRPPLRVLLVEDREFDARLVVGLLASGGYQVTSRRVEDAAALQAALARETWDLVVADHQLPGLDAATALRLVQSSGQDVPFIVVSGGIGEETAVALMKAGAHDFLVKGQLNRLVPVVERELREARNRAERRAGELRLRRLWESSPDAILMMDDRGCVAFVNPAAEVLFGRPAAELLGRPFETLAAPAETGPPASPGDAAPAGPRLLEMVGRRGNDQEVIMEVAFSDIEMQGRHYHVAFVRDITARRAAERALRSAEQEFGLARDIQQRLFPRRAPVVPGFDIAGRTYPAVQTGGDYYDFLPMPEGDWGLVVSDVSGHGMGPALIMAETRAYLRIAAHNRRDAGLVLTRANSVLAEDLEDGTQFVTSLLVRLTPRSPDGPALAFANAGHTAGYVLAADGTVRLELARQGPPLGVLPDTEYAESPPFSLARGDVLLLLTDGIEETESASGAIFGTERLLNVVRTYRALPAAELLTAIWQAARDFSQGQPQKDDWTAIVAKVT